MMKQTGLFGTGLIVLFAGGFALAASDALAQGGTPLTIDKATVSPEVAKRTLVKSQISAPVARQLVDACLEFARNQQGGPGTYAIYVLAPNGDIVDAHVMDGVLPIGAETGLLKAKTALYARSSVERRRAALQHRGRPADSAGPREGIRPGLLLRRRRAADRRTGSADWRDRRRRREHGRAVRLSGPHEGARAAAAVAGAATAGRRRRSRRGPRRGRGQ